MEIKQSQTIPLLGGARGGFLRVSKFQKVFSTQSPTPQSSPEKGGFWYCRYTDNY